MLRLVLFRLSLVALPFAVWFVWRLAARRSGRPMGSTPYTWLFAAGAVLVGLSLLATVIFHGDNRQERYVPGEATPGGDVTQGHFEQRGPNPR